MRISYNWLQEYFEKKLPSPEKLAELLTMHSFEIDSVTSSGSPASKEAGLPSDWILDVKVMPDRAHDCLSYWGIAKEIGTLTGLDVKPMIFPTEGDEVVKTSALINLKIETDLCRRAMKRLAIGVTIGPSPQWLKNRLESVGQRSINNIVDIANFVMLETGQPVHAFDLDKLSGDGKKDVLIRAAKPSETIKTLDGKEFILDDSILVIADEKKPLDIAGIKGGADSGIDENTVNVLLSACNFDPINIRQTSSKLGLRTDASERFEKEISPALVCLAMDYLSFLVKEIAGGYLASDMLDFYPKKALAPQIAISHNEINRLLGVKIKEKEIEDIFRRLGFQFSKPYSKEVLRPGLYLVTPPIERLDIKIKEDIVEEIGRVYGYENIPCAVPSVEQKNLKHDENFLKIEWARRHLLALGYSEVYAYTFVHRGEVGLINPLAEDKKFLRANLKDGVLEAVAFNSTMLPLLGLSKLSELKIFEIGTVFTKEKEEIHVAYNKEENISEIPLDEYIKTLPKEEIEFVVSGKEFKYKPISIYPFISRDIAVWVPALSEVEGPDEVGSDKLYNFIKKNAGPLLVREPKLFDKFTKDGRISYAYRLVFQSQDRTLTDEEINKIMAKISLEISKNSLWQIR